MKVHLLTSEQAEQLRGQTCTKDMVFGPILDGNEQRNWIISTQEATACTNPEFNWVKELPLIDWVKPTYTNGNED